MAALHGLSILAQAALRAPPEVPFAMRSWPLLLPTFSLLVQACLRAKLAIVFATP